MGRPKQTKRRDHQLNISLTAEEHAHVRARAAEAAMRPVDYARWLLLRSPRSPVVVAAAAQIDRLTYQQLKRLGNTLNQIARHLNTMRGPAPPTLDLLLRDIRAVLTRGTELGS